MLFSLLESYYGFIKLPLSVGSINDNTSPTNSPVPSQQHPDSGARQPGSESDSATTHELVLTRATELNIVTEPDRVYEPASSSIAEGVNVEFVGMEVSPAQSPASKSECLAIALENCFDFGEIDFLSPLLPPESVCYVPNSLAPPRLLLPPPLQNTVEIKFCVGFCTALQALLQSPVNPATQSSLPLISPSLPPLSGGSTPQACWEPSLSGCGKPMDPPPASARSTTPRPVTLTPALHPPSTSAVIIGRSASPGSLGPLALPGSDITAPPLQTVAPPFLRVCLPPQSFQLNLSPLDPCCHLGGSSLRLLESCCCIGSLAAWWASSTSSSSLESLWCRLSLHIHGSCLLQRHRGALSQLWPGSTSTCLCSRPFPSCPLHLHLLRPFC